MVMNKQELIEQMVSDTKMSKTNCKRALEAFIKAIEKALKKKETVSLTGFGTFGVAKRKARVGVNPVTGQKMNIPAKKVPKFKAGKKLKEVVS